MWTLRSPTVRAGLRSLACGLVLSAAGSAAGYQDGRIEGWTPSSPSAPGSVAQTGEADADADADGGRAELRLPDLRTRPPTDMYVVDARSEGGPVRLKFTTLIWNAGDGPLEVRGDPDEADGGREVEQHAVDADGRWHAVGPVGRFDVEHRHGHLHLSGFADYELWTLPGDLSDPGDPTARPDGPGELIAENVKIGFCLMDNVVVDEAMAADGAAYTSCEAEVQGISPGYGDLYVAELYEQDIDITDVPDGRYRLVNVANPDGVLRESDAANNVGFTDVELRTDADGRRVVASQR